MADFFFVLKMFLFSIVLILIMQVKVGPMTLEERAYVILQSSAITHQLQKVADGGVKAYQQVETAADKFYQKNFGTPEKRKAASEKVRNLKLEMRRKAAHASAVTRSTAQEEEFDDEEDIQPATGAPQSAPRTPVNGASVSEAPAGFGSD